MIEDSFVIRGWRSSEVFAGYREKQKKHSYYLPSMQWASEHVVGVAKDVPEEIKAQLRAEFQGECSEVGMYLAMSRAAMREGLPEVGMERRKPAADGHYI